MVNLTGKWEGEYSYNHGTEDEPDLEFYPFSMDIIEQDGFITGTSTDIDPQLGNAFVKGFKEGDFLSFIKKYDKSTQDMEARQRFYDVYYSGNYDNEDQAFVGIWEITVSEERKGFTDEFVDELLTGTWFIKRA